MSVALALFFLTPPASASAVFEEAFYGFLTHVTLGVIVLALLGFAAVKFLPGRFTHGFRGHIKIIGASNVGRDMIYIVKTGPDVAAFISGRFGVTVLGRWSLEEWDDYEAAAKTRESRGKDSLEQP